MAVNDYLGFDRSAHPVRTLDEPYANAAAITPDDANDLAHLTRAIYVGGAGNLAVVMLGGQTVTFTAPPVGTVLRVRAARVKSTGTTATLLVALW